MKQAEIDKTDSLRRDFDRTFSEGMPGSTQAFSCLQYTGNHDFL
jgi:hypothetical protein